MYMAPSAPTIPTDRRPPSPDLVHGAFAVVGQLVATPFVLGAVLGNPTWFVHGWRVRGMFAPSSELYTVAALAGLLAAVASYGTRPSVTRVEWLQRAVMVWFVAHLCAWVAALSLTDPPIVLDLRQLWRVALLGALPGVGNLWLVVHEHKRHRARQASNGQASLQR